MSLDDFDGEDLFDDDLGMPKESTSPGLSQKTCLG